jgi:CspA family cold shock protein
METSSSSNSEVHSTGCVKWFNNKSGFGFITATSGSKIGSDIFVHHSGIKVTSEQYRYLVQGEYVEFDVSDVGDNKKYEFHATNVSGINGGRLMCETRQLVRESKVQYKTKTSDSVPKESIPVKRPRGRPAKTDDRQKEKGDWTQVKKTFTKKSSGTATSSA